MQNILKQGFVITAQAGIQRLHSNFKHGGFILLDPVMDYRLRGNDDILLSKG